MCIYCLYNCGPMLMVVLLFLACWGTMFGIYSTIQLLDSTISILETLVMTPVIMISQ